MSINGEILLLRTQLWWLVPGGAAQAEIARTNPALGVTSPWIVSQRQAEHSWVAILILKNPKSMISNEKMNEQNSESVFLIPNKIKMLPAVFFAIFFYMILFVQNLIRQLE